MFNGVRCPHRAGILGPPLLTWQHAAIVQQVWSAIAISLSFALQHKSQ